MRDSLRALMGSGRLPVEVGSGLTLDAGSIEEVWNGGGSGERLVRPPARSLFEQLLAHLSSNAVVTSDRQLDSAQEALAALAVSLRWGSYLAVLTDPQKPVWTRAKTPAISHVSDSEMARINIEASAALERWIELKRTRPDEYASLVRAALQLPLPIRTVRPATGMPFAALADIRVSKSLVAASPKERLDTRRSEAKQHPTRVLANAIVNACWRNGTPLEALHAGHSVPLPLMRRRFTPAQERRLLQSVANRLTTALSAINTLIDSSNKRDWSELVLPFNLADFLLVTPLNWSLTETTREVRLRGRETA